MTDEDDPKNNTNEGYTSISDFLKELACDMVFENKQSLSDAMNTDILMYIELLSIKLKKLREESGEKKEYIDQITWL